MRVHYETFLFQVHRKCRLSRDLQDSPAPKLRHALASGSACTDPASELPVNDVAPSDGAKGDVSLEGRNICVIYDCLFPLTHGGAERWYRVLVDRFVAAGATVTYLTRQQWTGDSPEWPGVQVVAVSGASQLYDAEGTRRPGPALAYGTGTLSWMVRHRHDYHAVVVASFPFFSLLAARGALLGTGTPVFVDYHEVWSSSYWRTYAGQFTGTVGAIIQGLCIRASRFAQVFTSQSARQLRSLGFRGDVKVLAGLLPGGRGSSAPSLAQSENPMVLFVGRHVKHKGVALLPHILAEARKSSPSLKMTVVSDGPERVGVEREVDRLGLTDAVLFTGSVSDDELFNLFAQASCTIVPSLREGYGIVVAESVSAGTPVVVADNPENLATHLVESGVNGFVVEPTVHGMAQGIVDAIDAGEALRRSTAEWGVTYSATKSIDRSADEMVERLSTFARKVSQRGER
jgi:glycosyltransferase involved in cell wall biosynthesis